MAVELATAWVSIVPSMQGADRTIAKELGGMSMAAPGKAMGTSLGARMGTAIKGTMGDTFNAVKGLAATTFAAVGGIVAANLGGAIRDADLINNFPKVMQSLGYDTAEADKQIRRISGSLDGLPTSTSSIVGLVKGLAPMSGSLKEATDLSLALNNAVLAGGESQEVQNSALEQYRQMLSAGKPDMAAWRSMQSAMPGQLDQLAQSLLGAEANSMDLYDAMQAGTVSFEDFNGAVLDLNENGLDGFDSFETAARNATGGIGTAMENAGNRVKRAIRTIIEAIGVEDISGRINEFTSQFPAIGEKIAGYIEQIKTGEIDFSGLSGGIAPVIGVIIGFASKLIGYLPVIGRFIPAISGPVGFVIGMFVQMWQNSERLREAVGELFSRLSDNSSSIMPIFERLSEVLGTVATVLGDVLGMLIEGVIWVFDQIQTEGTLLNEIFNNIVDVVMGAFSIIEGIFKTIGAVLKGDWSAAWAGIKQILSGAWKIIISVLKAAWSLAVAAIKAGIKLGIAAVRNFPKLIKSALSGAGKWLLGVGKDIMRGLRDGIDAGFAWIKSRLQGVGRAIPGWLKKILGIASPSRVMANEVGKWILPGVALGVDASESDFRRSVESALDLSDIHAEVPGITAGPFAAMAGGGFAGAGGREFVQIDPRQVEDLVRGILTGSDAVARGRVLSDKWDSLVSASHSNGVE